ncbi:MAG: DCC1-like thiol-disulfide oxidoreductase family protein [Myxococcota bacterium]
MRRTTRGPLPEGIAADDRVVLFDAACVVCAGWVHFLLRWDPPGKLRIGAVQAPLGRALLAYADLPTDDVDTMLFVEEGRAYAKSSAFLRVCRHLRFPLPLLAVGLLVPTPVRDWLYDRLAKNRYRLFGKQEICLIPSPEQRARFLPE